MNIGLPCAWNSLEVVRSENLSRGAAPSGATFPAIFAGAQVRLSPEMRNYSIRSDLGGCVGAREVWTAASGVSRRFPRADACAEGPPVIVCVGERDFCG
jgi:hypothetical protein